MNNDPIHLRCEAFVARLKEIRLQKGLSTYQLAELSGIQRPNIARIESGKFFPSLHNIMRIADALDVEVVLS